MKTIKCEFEYSSLRFLLDVSPNRYTVYVGESSQGKTTLIETLKLAVQAGLTTFSNGYNFVAVNSVYDLDHLIESLSYSLFFGLESLCFAHSPTAGTFDP